MAIPEALSQAVPSSPGVLMALVPLVSDPNNTLNPSLLL